jgi:hypothetical protein
MLRKDGSVTISLRNFVGEGIIKLFKNNQTCIERAIKGTWKCVLYEQLPFVNRLKLYALFINGENEAALYKTVICYTEVPFKAGLTVFYFLTHAIYHIIIFYVPELQKTKV